MSQNRANLREARRKNAMFGTFWANFLQNTAIFSNIWLQIFKIPILWKNSRALGKKLKHFEKKLNEPVVTNYIRYHKSVEKKAWSKLGFAMAFLKQTQ